MDGHVVASSEEFQERCYEVEYATADKEMLFVGARDFKIEGDYLVADVLFLITFLRECRSGVGLICRLHHLSLIPVILPLEIT